MVKAVTLQQSFVAECAPLTSFQIWPFKPSGLSDQATTYTLRDSVSGNVVATTTLSNLNVLNQQWLEIPVLPIMGSKNRQYAIEITTTNENVSSALSFSVTARHEYTPGQFLINSQLQSTDLVFQYGCTVR